MIAFLSRFAVCALALLFAAAAAATSPHTIAPGETLSALCQAAYGSEHYAELIALHDGVKAEALHVGDSLELPTLDVLVSREGLANDAGAAAVLEARAIFVPLKPLLWGLAGKSTPPPVAADRAALGRASATMAAVAAARGPGAGQAKTAALLFAQLGTGNPDPNGYAVADVDRRLAAVLVAIVRTARDKTANALVHGLAWRFDPSVRVSAAARTYAFRSHAPISEDASGKTYLRFDVVVTSYDGAPAASAAFAALEAKADPNSGLSYAWDTVWLDGARVIHLQAPCLFSTGSVRSLEANTTGALMATAAAARTLHCSCGGGCDVVTPSH